MVAERSGRSAFRARLIGGAAKGAGVVGLLVAMTVLTAPPTGVGAAPRAGLAPVAASRMTLTRAPAGLQVAAQRTLGSLSATSADPVQEAELTDPARDSGDDFGFSMAISGTTAVIGVPNKNADAGAAYVFTRSGTTWSQQAELTGDCGTDNFGYSVAISGTTAVIGCQAGAAYVFTRSGTTWSQQAELTAPANGFGSSVAISGTTAVVGAWAQDNSAGAAYVFTRSGTTWSQQAELTAPAAASRFGISVAVSGMTVVIGAFGVNSSAGAGYVFTRSGTTWSQQAELIAPAGGFYLVAVSGTTAVIGAYAPNSAAAAAYVFTRSGTTWSQQAELTAAIGTGNFGFSMAISGTTVVIGGGGVHSSVGGAAYVFTRSGTSWSQQAELTDPAAAVTDEFGTSVAVSGTTVVVGAPGANSSAGAAYVYALGPSPLAGQSSLLIKLTVSSASSGEQWVILNTDEVNSWLESVITDLSDAGYISGVSTQPAIGVISPAFLSPNDIAQADLILTLLGGGQAALSDFAELGAWGAIGDITSNVVETYVLPSPLQVVSQEVNGELYALTSTAETLIDETSYWCNSSGIDCVAEPQGNPSSQTPGYDEFLVPSGSYLEIIVKGLSIPLGSSIDLSDLDAQTFGLYVGTVVDIEAGGTCQLASGGYALGTCIETTDVSDGMSENIFTVSGAILGQNGNQVGADSVTFLSHLASIYGAGSCDHFLALQSGEM